ncbi:hypothetical protein TWF192_005716 [Orbilia oligospora]|uniref:Uncharacterized protein n=1 Tax=Orbilia oligospora TaxID=2813651 RepID=A0A6G1MML1_ORBOL|nr:hypothetical protein TWF191_003923 [Orbilia oligospora]KAF3263435.1 hypothetical protein TWF192_005716 [Orbilia oligospora]
MADDRAVQPEIEVGLTTRRNERTRRNEGLRRNAERAEQRAQRLAEARRTYQLGPQADETHNRSDQGGVSETLVSAGARAATVAAIPTRATARPAENVAPTMEAANSHSNRQLAEEQRRLIEAEQGRRLQLLGMERRRQILELRTANQRAQVREQQIPATSTSATSRPVANREQPQVTDQRRRATVESTPNRTSPSNPSLQQLLQRLLQERPTALPPITQNRGGPVVPTVRHDSQNRRHHPSITPASNIGGPHTTSGLPTTPRATRLSGTQNIPTATLQAHSDEVARQLSNIQGMMANLFTGSNNAQQNPFNGQRGLLPSSRSTAESIERNSEQRRGASDPNYTSERTERNNDNSGGQVGASSSEAERSAGNIDNNRQERRTTNSNLSAQMIDQNSRQQEGASISSSEVERIIHNNDNNGLQEGVDDSNPSVEVTDWSNTDQVATILNRVDNMVDGEFTSLQTTRRYTTE